MLAGLRPWVELLYFASGIVISVSVVYGLKQVRLLKRDIRLRNERAAKEKAIEYSSRYLDSYVQLSNAFLHDCDGAKLGSSYSGPIGDFTDGSLLANPGALELARSRFKLNSCVRALNELEAISAAFTSGVADEGTGFNIVGRSFCKNVQYDYDVISFARDARSGAPGYWSNIVRLYEIWSPRLEEADLRQVRERIDDRIAAATKQGVRIPPIGTE